jgi:FixJ family two-component response regulator
MGDRRTGDSDGRRPAPLIGVVDDDECVRDSISSLIRSAGYRTAVFPSAEAFLSSDGMRETDCLVLDIRMAGLSGLELQRRLAEPKFSIRIVFVTGQDSEELRSRALKQGAVAFLGKPFNDEALLGAIRSALECSSMSASGLRPVYNASFR